MTPCLDTSEERKCGDTISSSSLITLSTDNKAAISMDTIEEDSDEDLYIRSRGKRILKHQTIFSCIDTHVSSVALDTSIDLVKNKEYGSEFHHPIDTAVSLIPLSSRSLLTNTFSEDNFYERCNTNDDTVLHQNIASENLFNVKDHHVDIRIPKKKRADIEQSLPIKDNKVESSQILQSSGHSNQKNELLYHEIESTDIYSTDNYCSNPMILDVDNPTLANESNYQHMASYNNKNTLIEVDSIVTKQSIDMDNGNPCEDEVQSDQEINILNEIKGKNNTINSGVIEVIEKTNLNHTDTHDPSNESEKHIVIISRDTNFTQDLTLIKKESLNDQEMINYPKAIKKELFHVMEDQLEGCISPLLKKSVELDTQQINQMIPKTIKFETSLSENFLDLHKPQLEKNIYKSNRSNKDIHSVNKQSFFPNKESFEIQKDYVSDNIDNELLTPSVRQQQEEEEEQKNESMRVLNEPILTDPIIQLKNYLLNPQLVIGTHPISVPFHFENDLKTFDWIGYHVKVVIDIKDRKKPDTWTWVEGIIKFWNPKYRRFFIHFFEDDLYKHIPDSNKKIKQDDLGHLSSTLQQYTMLRPSATVKLSMMSGERGWFSALDHQIRFLSFSPIWIPPICYVESFNDFSTHLNTTIDNLTEKQQCSIDNNQQHNICVICKNHNLSFSLSNKKESTCSQREQTNHLEDALHNDVPAIINQTHLLNSILTCTCCGDTYHSDCLLPHQTRFQFILGRKEMSEEAKHHRQYIREITRQHRRDEAIIMKKESVRNQLPSSRIRSSAHHRTLLQTSSKKRQQELNEEQFIKKQKSVMQYSPHFKGVNHPGLNKIESSRNHDDNHMDSQSHHSMDDTTYTCPTGPKLRDRRCLKLHQTVNVESDENTDDFNMSSDDHDSLNSKQLIKCETKRNKKGHNLLYHDERLTSLNRQQWLGPTVSFNKGLSLCSSLKGTPGYNNLKRPNHLNVKSHTKSTKKKVIQKDTNCFIRRASNSNETLLSENCVKQTSAITTPSPEISKLMEKLSTQSMKKIEQLIRHSRGKVSNGALQRSIATTFSEDCTLSVIQWKLLANFIRIRERSNHWVDVKKDEFPNTADSSLPNELLEQDHALSSTSVTMKLENTVELLPELKQQLDSIKTEDNNDHYTNKEFTELFNETDQQTADSNHTMLTSNVDDIQDRFIITETPNRCDIMMTDDVLTTDSMTRLTEMNQQALCSINNDFILDKLEVVHDDINKQDNFYEEMSSNTPLSSYQTCIKHELKNLEVLDTSITKSDFNTGDLLQKTSPWLCPNCLICHYCCEPLKKVPLINTTSRSLPPPIDANGTVLPLTASVVCYGCGMAAHGSCCFPEVPVLHANAKWRCDKCSVCRSCQYKDLYWSDYTAWDVSFEHCARCYKAIELGKYCAVCRKVWDTEIGLTNLNWLFCDSCHLWVHVDCDAAEAQTRCLGIATGIGNPANADEIITRVGGSMYRCPVCRCSERHLRYLRIIERLIVMDRKREFSFPVPRTFVSYWRVVKHPMNLSEMKAKNYLKLYSTDEEFITDFCLIIHNARLVHMPNTRIHRNACSLEKRGFSLLQRVLDLPKLTKEITSNFQSKAAQLASVLPATLSIITDISQCFDIEQEALAAEKRTAVSYNAMELDSNGMNTDQDGCVTTSVGDNCTIHDQFNKISGAFFKDDAFAGSDISPFVRTPQSESQVDGIDFRSGTDIFVSPPPEEKPIISDQQQNFVQLQSLQRVSCSDESVVKLQTTWFEDIIEPNNVNIKDNTTTNDATNCALTEDTFLVSNNVIQLSSQLKNLECMHCNAALEQHIIYSSETTQFNPIESINSMSLEDYCENQLYYLLQQSINTPIILVCARCCRTSHLACARISHFLFHPTHLLHPSQLFIQLFICLDCDPCSHCHHNFIIKPKEETLSVDHIPSVSKQSDSAICVQDSINESSFLYLIQMILNYPQSPIDHKTRDNAVDSTSKKNGIDYNTPLDSTALASTALDSTALDSTALLNDKNLFLIQLRTLLLKQNVSKKQSLTSYITEHTLLRCLGCLKPLHQTCLLQLNKETPSSALQANVVPSLFSPILTSNNIRIPLKECRVFKKLQEKRDHLKSHLNEASTMLTLSSTLSIPSIIPVTLDDDHMTLSTQQQQEQEPVLLDDPNSILPVSTIPIEHTHTILLNNPHPILTTASTLSSTSEESINIDSSHILHQSHHRIPSKMIEPECLSSRVINHLPSSSSSSSGYVVTDPSKSRFHDQFNVFNENSCTSMSSTSSYQTHISQSPYIPSLSVNQIKEGHVDYWTDTESQQLWNAYQTIGYNPPKLASILRKSVRTISNKLTNMIRQHDSVSSSHITGHKPLSHSMNPLSSLHLATNLYSSTHQVPINSDNMYTVVPSISRTHIPLFNSHESLKPSLQVHTDSQHHFDQETMLASSIIHNPTTRLLSETYPLKQLESSLLMKSWDKQSILHNPQLSSTSINPAIQLSHHVDSPKTIVSSTDCINDQDKEDNYCKTSVYPMFYHEPHHQMLPYDASLDQINQSNVSSGNTTVINQDIIQASNERISDNHTNVTSIDLPTTLLKTPCLSNQGINQDISLVNNCHFPLNSSDTPLYSFQPVMPDISTKQSNEKMFYGGSHHSLIEHTIDTRETPPANDQIIAVPKQLIHHLSSHVVELPLSDTPISRNNQHIAINITTDLSPLYKKKLNEQDVYHPDNHVSLGHSKNQHGLMIIVPSWKLFYSDIDCTWKNLMQYVLPLGNVSMMNTTEIDLHKKKKQKFFTSLYHSEIMNLPIIVKKNDDLHANHKSNHHHHPSITLSTIGFCNECIPWSFQKNQEFHDLTMTDTNRSMGHQIDHPLNHNNTDYDQCVNTLLDSKRTPIHNDVLDASSNVTHNTNERQLSFIHNISPYQPIIDQYCHHVISCNTMNNESRWDISNNLQLTTDRQRNHNGPLLICRICSASCSAWDFEDLKDITSSMSQIPVICHQCRDIHHSHYDEDNQQLLETIHLICVDIRTRLMYTEDIRQLITALTQCCWSERSSISTQKMKYQVKKFINSAAFSLYRLRFLFDGMDDLDIQTMSFFEESSLPSQDHVIITESSPVPNIAPTACDDTLLPESTGIIKKEHDIAKVIQPTVVSSIHKQTQQSLTLSIINETQHANNKAKSYHISDLKSKLPQFQKWLVQHALRPKTCDYSFIDTTFNLLKTQSFPVCNQQVYSSTCILETIIKQKVIYELCCLDVLPSLWIPELPQHQKAVENFALWVTEQTHNTHDNKSASYQACYMEAKHEAYLLMGLFHRFFQWYRQGLREETTEIHQKFLTFHNEFFKLHNSILSFLNKLQQSASLMLSVPKPNNNFNSIEFCNVWFARIIGTVFLRSNPGIERKYRELITNELNKNDNIISSPSKPRKYCSLCSLEENTVLLGVLIPVRLPAIASQTKHTLLEQFVHSECLLWALPEVVTSTLQTSSPLKLQKNIQLYSQQIQIEPPPTIILNLYSVIALLEISKLNKCYHCGEHGASIICSRNSMPQKHLSTETPTISDTKHTSFHNIKDDMNVDKLTSMSLLVEKGRLQTQGVTSRCKHINMSFHLPCFWMWFLSTVNYPNNHQLNSLKCDVSHTLHWNINLVTRTITCPSCWEQSQSVSLTKDLFTEPEEMEHSLCGTHNESVADVLHSGNSKHLLNPLPNSVLPGWGGGCLSFFNWYSNQSVIIKPPHPSVVNVLENEFLPQTQQTEHFQTVVLEKDCTNIRDIWKSHRRHRLLSLIGLSNPVRSKTVPFQADSSFLNAKNFGVFDSNMFQLLHTGTSLTKKNLNLRDNEQPHMFGFRSLRRFWSTETFRKKQFVRNHDVHNHLCRDIHQYETENTDINQDQLFSPKNSQIEQSFEADKNCFSSLQHYSLTEYLCSVDYDRFQDIPIYSIFEKVVNYIPCEYPGGIGRTHSHAQPSHRLCEQTIKSHSDSLLSDPNISWNLISQSSSLQSCTNSFYGQLSPMIKFFVFKRFNSSNVDDVSGMNNNYLLSPEVFFGLTHLSVIHKINFEREILDDYHMLTYGCSRATKCDLSSSDAPFDVRIHLKQLTRTHRARIWLNIFPPRKRCDRELGHVDEGLRMLSTTDIPPLQEWHSVGMARGACVFSASSAIDFPINMNTRRGDTSSGISIPSKATLIHSQGRSVSRNDGRPTSGRFSSRQKFDRMPSAMQYRCLMTMVVEQRVEAKLSPIHGMGLFAVCYIPKGEPVVEYVGDVIRNVIADKREKVYELTGNKDASCYLFRLNENYVVDATTAGNVARFINHSCEPNCVCRVISAENGTNHIVIFASREIQPGEEVTYDYKFNVEEESLRIVCQCGAASCLGRMN